MKTRIEPQHSQLPRVKYSFTNSVVEYERQVKALDRTLPDVCK